MPRISSNTLFHFTNSKNSLISILERTFIPNFCLEDWSSFEKDVIESSGDTLFHMAIPIVSFCDIPLSQTTNHMETYGKYAIGLKKEWGIRNGISPVLYMHHDSPVVDSLTNLIDIELDQDDLNYDYSTHIGRLFTLCKPYEGTFKHHDYPEKNVRFYDEREWRYVAVEENGDISTIQKSQYDKKVTNGDSLEHPNIRISFEPKDISYIIVEHESEIHEMIESIKDIKEKYDQLDIELLITRIISSERIETDF